MESDQVYRAHQKVHPREELERSFREAWLPRKEMGLLATMFKPDGLYIGRTGLYPFRTGGSGVIVPGEAPARWRSISRGVTGAAASPPRWGRPLSNTGSAIWASRRSTPE